MSRERVVQVNPDDRVWTPAQILALVLGVAFAVLGGVALLRTGVSGSLVEPTTSVAGLAYTPLLGVIEIIFGLLLIGVGVLPRASSGAVFLGAIALVFGLVLVIEPAPFERSLAAGRAHGWLYVVAGGVTALVGLLTPTVMARRDRVATGGARGREGESATRRSRAGTGDRPAARGQDRDVTRPLDQTEDQDGG